MWSQIDLNEKRNIKEKWIQMDKEEKHKKRNI